jgi:mono/diheme cytochrome c family protein
MMNPPFIHKFSFSIDAVRGGTTPMTVRMPVRRNVHAVGAVTLGVILVCGPAPRVLAQAAGAPAYTAAQADAGKAQFQTTCAPCHGADLSGGEGPDLAGAEFLKRWGKQTTSDLFKYVQGMPPGGPALTDPEYVTVVAYILQQNGAAAGDKALEATTAVPIESIATGKAPAVVLAVSHGR